MTVQPTQVALANAMAADRQERFRVLLERHRGIAFKVANTYAWNADDRADLAQEIAAQLWRAFPRYDDSRPFATWMYRVALNVGISFLRGRSADAREVALDAEHEAIAAPPGNSLEGAERLRRLERAIARLDGLNRALLLLYLEERSYAEIAEILGISETNVGTKLARLRSHMRQELLAEEAE
jgi:RNA polymerase sigma factor (sigma-70 family)